MEYYCELCNMFITPKSKSRQFKTNNHKNSDKHKHIKLTLNNPNIDNIDKIFYSRINKVDNKYEYYLVRCEVKLCFINMKEYGGASSELTDNKMMVFKRISKITFKHFAKN